MIINCKLLDDIFEFEEMCPSCQALTAEYTHRWPKMPAIAASRPASQVSSGISGAQNLIPTEGEQDQKRVPP